MDITIKQTSSLGDDRENELCRRITKLVMATQKRLIKENPYRDNSISRIKEPDFDFRRLKRADGKNHLSVIICSHRIEKWEGEFNKDFQSNLRRLLTIITGVKAPNVYLIKPVPKSSE